MGSFSKIYRFSDLKETFRYFGVFLKKAKNFDFPKKKFKKLKFTTLRKKFNKKRKYLIFFQFLGLSFFYYSSFSGAKIYKFTSKKLLLKHSVLWSQHWGIN